LLISTRERPFEAGSARRITQSGPIVKSVAVAANVHNALKTLIDELKIEFY
jgi:hypothetical protein